MGKDLNPNKMHLEKLQEIMQSVDRDEAVSMSKILVRRYPDVILNEINTYIQSMSGTIKNLNSLVNGGN